jgi:hypothetical protein
VLSEDTSRDTVDSLLGCHRRALGAATGVTIEPATWRRGYVLALKDLIINRLALYQLAHSLREYPFIERVLRTARHLLRLELAAG